MGLKLQSDEPENEKLNHTYIVSFDKVEYRPMKEEVKKADSVEVMISTQLEKFEVKEEDLQVLVTKYSELVVTGVDDKAGRKAVSEARKHLKATRTGITNIGKELRDIPNKLSKAIIKREKEFIDIISPEEDRLAQIESDIAEEEEEIRQQKAHEEQERIIARTKELEGYGATFNGVQYELGDNVLTLTEVKVFTDIEFTRKMEFFKESFEKEQQRLTWVAEQELLKFDSFMEVLFEDGWAWDEGDLISKGYNHVLNPDILKTWSDADLKAHMESVNAKIKQHADEVEAKRIADESLKAEQAKLAEIQKQQELKQAELDRKQKELDDQLANAKLEKELAAARIHEIERQAQIKQFESRRSTLNNTPNLIDPALIREINSDFYWLDDTQWTAFVHDCKYSYEKEQERLVKEAEKAAAAEEQRRIEMQPDVELLKQISVDLKGTIVSHHMKTAKGAAVLNNINELKSKTVKYIEEQIKNL